MDGGDEASPMAALIDELNFYRLVLTDGRFTAATGFAVIDDATAVELKAEHVPADRPAQLQLSWK